MATQIRNLFFYILNIIILVKVQLTENKEYIIFICITRAEDNSISLYFLDLPRFLGGTLVSLAAKKKRVNTKKNNRRIKKDSLTV